MNCVSLFKDDLKRFLSLKNPLFRTEADFAFYTARRGEKLLGRITTHIHHASNEKYGWKRAYFGFFDCANDQEAADALLQKAVEFARQHQCDEVMGNFNLTAMQQIGVVTEIKSAYHFSDQVFGPLYLAELLKKSGFEAFFPMTTHEMLLSNFDEEKLVSENQKKLLADTDFSFMDLTKADVKEVLEVMRLCLNGGFSENPMFVPLTSEEIAFQAKDLMLVVDRKISMIVKYKGKPIATLVCIPDLVPFLRSTKSQMGWRLPFEFIKFKRNRDSAVIIFYSVLKEYHSQGVNGLMLYRLLKALKSQGYKKLGGTWIADENKASLRQAEKLGGKTMHRLHLFRKKV